MSYKHNQNVFKIDQDLNLVLESQNNLKEEMMRIINDKNLANLQNENESLKIQLEEKNHLNDVLNENILKNSENYEHISRDLYKKLADQEIEIHFLRKKNLCSNNLNK